MPKNGSGNLPTVECPRQLLIPNFDRQLIQILPIEIVPDVVVAWAVIAGEFSRQRGKDPSRGKLKESPVRNCTHAAAPGVFDLSLQTMSEPLCRLQLKSVVVTVLASGKLRHRAESLVGRLPIAKWRKTALTNSLVAVHLSEVRLIHCASADVLHLRAGTRPELMFNAQAPLHEVRRM